MRRSLQTCRVTARRKPAAYLRDRAHASNASSSPTRTDDAVAARADGRTPADPPRATRPRPWLHNATHIAEIKLWESDRVPFLTKSIGDVSANRNQSLLAVIDNDALRYDAIVNGLLHLRKSM